MTPPLITYPNAASLYFDGVNDVVDIANSVELENLQEGSYTYAAWFRPDDVPVAGTNEGQYAVVAKTGWHMSIRYGRGDGSGQFAVEHWLTGDVWTGTGGANGRAPLNWYHVAGVVDRTAGQGQLYVNGTPDSSWTFTANTAAREYGTSSFKIGNANPGAAYGSWRWAAKGRIDDVRIYNYPLSAAQVQVLAMGVPTPTGVTAVPLPNSVQVSWTAPAPAGVTYTYTLVRVEPGNVRTTLLTGTTATSYTDLIVGGTTVTYEVTATSVATSGPAVSNSTTALFDPPRFNDHEEGFVDRNCGCGSSTFPGAAWWALGLSLAFLGLALRR